MQVASIETGVEVPLPLDAGTPTQPVHLDHQTGQSRITTLRSRHSADGTYCHPEQPRPTTPHPPLPAKPKNLGDKLSQLSPRKELTASPDKRRQTSPIIGRAVGVVVLDNNLTGVDGSQEKSPTETVNENQIDSKKEEVNIIESTDGVHTTTVTGSHFTPPPPPPLPPQLTVTRHTAVGTMQFVGPQKDPPTEGEPLDDELTNEAQDPSLELPTSEERSLLLNEISSVGQAILRRTNRNRSPGGTPIRANKNRLTLTGNTDMLQRALISKFRSFHSTPIKRGDKTDSMDASNAWSDVNGSIVFDDPDITAASNSPMGLSDRSKLDPNLSSAV